MNNKWQIIVRTHETFHMSNVQNIPVLQSTRTYLFVIFEINWIIYGYETISNPPSTSNELVTVHKVEFVVFVDVHFLKPNCFQHPFNTFSSQFSFNTSA